MLRSRIGNFGKPEIWESRSRIFYLRLRTPAVEHTGRCFARTCAPQSTSPFKSITNHLRLQSHVSDVLESYGLKGVAKGVGTQITVVRCEYVQLWAAISWYFQGGGRVVITCCCI